ncbi:DUF5798 family protein [Haloarchaeobius sp. DFWS5]|uniref:DUF5798 family protein n=1 Tax=Haloarchaeobius sp. DFWS5 TaxID=3446114 RepID=UPI003EBB2B7E
MGLGSTAKKLQTVAERAEQLYAQMKDVRERVIKIEEDVDSTATRVTGVETELEEQRLLLEALAEEQGIDVDNVLADGAIVEAEATGEEATSDDDAAAAEPAVTQAEASPAEGEDSSGTTNE